MQMPHVFVVPPEEDETPAWCCFDAENPSRPHSSEILEQELLIMDSLCDSKDPFYRDPDGNYPDLSVAGESSADSMSVVDAFMKDEVHGDYASDSESEYDHDSPVQQDRTETGYGHRQSRRTLRDVANDSDVIEVVKVSRKRCPSEEAIANSQQQSATVKRSATLKNRASKVFKSIRGTLRSKSRPRGASNAAPPVPPLPAVPPLPQVQSPSEPHAPESGLNNLPPASSLTRRGSRILSQIFTGPSLKNRTSMASMETTKSPTSPTLPSPSFAHDLHPHPAVSPPASIHRDHAVDQRELHTRATSPTPTATSSRSTGRFSKLAIHKMFSFSSRSPSPMEPTRVIVNLDDDDAPNTTPSHSDYSTPPTRTPVVRDDDSTHTISTRAQSCTPPSVVSSTSTAATSAGPQTPISSGEATPDHLDYQKNVASFAAFDNFDSEGFNLSPNLNLGLGLGLNLDPTPVVEVQQKNPRPSFSSLSSLNSWKSLTGKRSSESAHPRPSQTFGALEEADMSLEMRLDSLHFDEMSFDADQFTLTSTR